MAVFTNLEHEFLRQAARADIYPVDLRAFARGLDWQYVIQTSMLHQLDGILAWRLQEPVLSDLIPLEARAFGVKHAENIAIKMQERANKHSEHRTWLEAARDITVAMTRKNIRHGFVGWVQQWQMYDMPFMPRCTSDIDMIVANDDYWLVSEALEEAGYSYDASLWEAELAALESVNPTRKQLDAWYVGGQLLRWERGSKNPTWPVELLTYNRHWLDFSNAAICANITTDTHTIDGVALPLISPELSVVYHANYQFAACCLGGQPLGRIAMIANWIKGHGFDWQKVLNILTDGLQRANENRGNLTIDNVLSRWWLANWQQETLAGRCGWVLNVVNHIYDCVPAAIITQINIMLGGAPNPTVWIPLSGEEDFPAALTIGERKRWTKCGEVSSTRAKFNISDIENFIFSPTADYYPERMLAKGWLNIVPNAPVITMRLYGAYPHLEHYMHQFEYEPQVLEAS